MFEEIKRLVLLGIKRKGGTPTCSNILVKFSFKQHSLLFDKTKWRRTKEDAIPCQTFHSRRVPFLCPLVLVRSTKKVFSSPIINLYSLNLIKHVVILSFSRMDVLLHAFQWNNRKRMNTSQKVILLL